MKWRLILPLLVLLAPLRVLADTSFALSSAADHLCRQAIAAAERAHGIPTHLLAAIARVESGRRDQASGTFNPWPWTINFDGQGSFYDAKAQAVIAATRLRPKAVRSIDVGCMQISLTSHPDAFFSLDQAFDPMSNADYGARFLAQLYEKTGTWQKAVAWYHSATPDLGRDYQQKVYAALPDEQKMAEVVPSARVGNWASPMSRSPFSSYASLLHPPSPHIIPRITELGSGQSAPGRTLDSYRAAPIRLAMRGF